jgi:hypothetical protein
MPVVVPVSFLELTFSLIPILLTAYQHLKVLQINNIYLNGLQSLYNVTQDCA